MINKQATLMATLLTAAALGAAASQDRQEQHPAPSQTNSAESPLVAAPAKKPFTNIFVSPRPRLNAPQPPEGIVEAVDAESRPRVVCGMTLLPGNPAIDPKLVVRPRPSTPTTDHRIRSMTPTVCGG
jgi:cell division septation protein DedD